MAGQRDAGGKDTQIPGRLVQTGTNGKHVLCVHHGASLYVPSVSWLALDWLASVEVAHRHNKTRAVSQQLVI